MQLQQKSFRAQATQQRRAQAPLAASSIKPASAQKPVLSSSSAPAHSLSSSAAKKATKRAANLLCKATGSYGTGKATRPMNIVFVSAEVAPWSKVGYFVSYRCKHE